MASEQPIFHLAIPIDDVSLAKKFYRDGLNCQVGRENKNAVIFNFYGTQLVAHVTKQPLTKQAGIYPRHLGLILPTESEWQQLLERAKKRELSFYEEPKLRFPNKLTEHRTFFLEDPFHNLLEFKYYRHEAAIFGGREVWEIGDRD